MSADSLTTLTLFRSSWSTVKRVYVQGKILHLPQVCSGKSFLLAHGMATDVTPISVPRDREAVQETHERRRFEQSDGRIVPQCELIYQQAVHTGDVFLGLSGKTPSSVSCEALLLKIYLPKIDALEEMHLECKANRILLQSHDYKLMQHLPHQVNPERSQAQWKAKEHVLEIRLPICPISL